MVPRVPVTMMSTSNSSCGFADCRPDRGSALGASAFDGQACGLGQCDTLGEGDFGVGVRDVLDVVVGNPLRLHHPGQAGHASGLANHRLPGRDENSAIGGEETPRVVDCTLGVVGTVVTR